LSSPRRQPDSHNQLKISHLYQEESWHSITVRIVIMEIEDKKARQPGELILLQTNILLATRTVSIFYANKKLNRAFSKI
jgi:hypothetical protein